MLYDYPYENDEIYYMEEFLWRLDVPRWELDKRTIEFLHACDMLQEEHLSIRGCARETGIARSTLHKFIHEELGYYCSELKSLVIRQLRWNSQNISHFMRYRRRR